LEATQEAAGQGGIVERAGEPKLRINDLTLPFALVLVWQDDHIQALTGLASVFAIATPGLTTMRLREDAPKVEAGQPFSNVEAASWFDGGATTLEFKDGSTPSHLGLMVYGGQFLIVASSGMPLTESTVPNLLLPALEVLTTPVSQWGSIKSKPPDPLKQNAFVVHTSQEFTELMAAAADGQYGCNYVDDPQAGTRTHKREGSPFVTRLSLTREERAAKVGLDALASFTARQNADSAMMVLYVSHLLAPPAPLPKGVYAGGWVDLNDVARKIGLLPEGMRTAKESEAARAQVWDLIRFGARAAVIGSRSTTYLDRETGEPIPTQTDSAPWVIMNKERPLQAALFDTEIPLRVELVMSRGWTALTTRSETAQYLPFGEVLGAIPGGKAGGAWARVVGLAYLGFCRRNPRKALNGTLKPTRRELLDQYKAAVSPYQELLQGTNPLRVARYWFAAMAILADAGLLAKKWDAAVVWEDWKAAHTKQRGWIDAWLDSPAEIAPGTRLAAAMEARSESLPADRPRALGRARKKKS
jgi:hypothetical protein